MAPASGGRAWDQLLARRLHQRDLELERSARPEAHKMRRTERETWLKVICAMVGNG